jgi:large subunit ribosomal protein L15
MELHNLKKSKGAIKPKKRVGRGIGSGKGAHTTGRGSKGQKARSGYNLPVGFEGGQVPLFKKLPQIGGFKNPRPRKIVTVSLDKFNSFKDGSTVTPEDLVKMGILAKLSKGTQVKVLGTGEINKKVELQGFLFSRSAKENLEKAGAKIS